MTTFVLEGQGLEGNATHGTCRKPVRYLGLALHNDQQTHKFVAERNARGRISTVLEEEAVRICPDASIDQSDKIECDDLVICAMKQRLKSHVEKGSGRDSATHWRCSVQNCVEVSACREATKNAVENRRAAVEQAAPRLEP